MKNSYFTKKQLKEIREIALRLYLDTDPEGLDSEYYRAQVLIEATIIYLKRLGKLE